MQVIFLFVDFFLFVILQVYGHKSKFCTNCFDLTVATDGILL